MSALVKNMFAEAQHELLWHSDNKNCPGSMTSRLHSHMLKKAFIVDEIPSLPVFYQSMGLQRKSNLIAAISQLFYLS